MMNMVLKSFIKDVAKQLALAEFYFILFYFIMKYLCYYFYLINYYLNVLFKSDNQIIESIFSNIAKLYISTNFD